MTFLQYLRPESRSVQTVDLLINLVEKEWETQFSAITFILDDGTLFLAFRGTDETIVGWKEDFNMAFLSPVPVEFQIRELAQCQTVHIIQRLFPKWNISVFF